MDSQLSLNSREQVLMLELMEALTSSLELSQVLSHSYQVMAQLLPADYAALCVSKPGQPREYDWAVAEMPPEFFARYPEMAAEDFVRGAVVQQPNVVLRDSEMLPRNDLERSLVYQHCRELDMPLEHVMAVLLDMQRDWHGGITLYRERRHPFSERDRTLLQRLTPMLASTVRNCRTLGEVARRGQVLEELFHQQGTETIVLAPPGTEVMRSVHATALLERWFAPMERGPHGMPTLLLEHLMRLVSTGGLGKAVVPDTWERVGQGRTLKVTFVPLPEQGGRRLWALVLQEASHTLPVPAPWHELLTERELQVVGCLLRGWGNQLIAEDLGCSLGTVKKHLQHIFDKLGVDSRTALMNMAVQR